VDSVANCDPSIVVREEPDGDGLYAGWDIARNRNLSVVWFSELVGDITWTRAILVMADVPTPDQTERVARIMPRVHRLCMDKTGMGIPMFATMDRLFPGKVEGIAFGTATKETMAAKAKRRMEERRSDFRTTRPSGEASARCEGQPPRWARFGSTPHTAKNAIMRIDGGWAFYLSESAAEQGATIVHLAGPASARGQADLRRITHQDSVTSQHYLFPIAL
jgi:hypothetical protein